MSPHYDRYANQAEPQNETGAMGGGTLDDNLVEEAAGALREVEVEAAHEEFEVSSLRPQDLEGMTIDKLRIVAKELDVPDRATITEQDELIAAIRRRL